MRAFASVSRRSATAAHSALSLRVYARAARPCCGVQYRYSSSASETTTGPPKTIELNGKTYETDEWFNLPSTILGAMNRRLHALNDHPVSITRQIIEANFPAPKFTYHRPYDPVVSTFQNFDSLGFPKDHPGRSKTDTYYVNKETLLRTHTSAHQAETFQSNPTQGFLISADVYRRDEIDRSHYPAFHQMEGALMWDRSKVKDGDLTKAVLDDLEALPKHSMVVEDPNPTLHPERNPLQPEHTEAEVEAVAAHLKRSLELLVNDIFTRARAANKTGEEAEPLQVRWVEAYFPFTSPSWELEIFWQGDWLEVLGCGVVRHHIPANAGHPSQIGWAFGIGIERIAMLLFEISDIRLFWSQDERFLTQFKGVTEDLSLLKKFAPFSKHPACYKDVAFWLRPSSAAGGNSKASSIDFHENDVMEIIRDVGGDNVEDVRLVDEFVHPKTGRKSLCYRINYRSLERTLTNEETNKFHEEVRQGLADKLGVELR